MKRTLLITIVTFLAISMIATFSLVGCQEESAAEETQETAEEEMAEEEMAEERWLKKRWLKKRQKRP